MPLVHIVLCKVKPEILDSSSHFSDFQEGCRTLETMPSLKPLLLECAWSRPSYEDRAKGWNWGLYTKFESKAVYEQYRDHPEHRNFVVEKMRPNIDDIMAYDLEY